MTIRPDKPMEDIYMREVENIANRLRRMADDVYRRGTDVRPDSPLFDLPFTRAAGDVVETITDGFANTKLANIIHQAAQADLETAPERER